VTQAERDRYQALAKAHGIKLSTVMRGALERWAKRIEKKDAQ